MNSLQACSLKRARLQCIYFSLAIVALAFFEPALAETLALNPPRSLGPGEEFFAEAKKKAPNVVLVYIVNDRIDRAGEDRGGSYEFIIEALNSEAQKANEKGDQQRAKQLSRLRTAVEKDDQAFNAAVKADLDALKRVVNVGWMSKTHAARDVEKLVVISNSLNSETWGKYETEKIHRSNFYYQVWHSGDNLELKKVENAIYEQIDPIRTQPLSSFSYLQQMLGNVVSKLGGSEEKWGRLNPRFVLIFRDNGYSNRFFAPIYRGDLRESLTSEELADYAIDICKDSEDDTQLLTNFYRRLHPEHAVIDKVPRTGQSRIVLPFQLGEFAQKHQIEFPVVIHLSGRSGLEYANVDEEPPHLQELLTSGTGNQFDPSLPPEGQKIVSYDGYKVRNLGVLVTTNKQLANHRYVDFSRLLDEKYRKYQDLQQAVLQLMTDTAAGK